MPSPLFLSQPPPGFRFLTILRGVQLSILGAYRVLCNPEFSRDLLPLIKKILGLFVIAVALYLLANTPIFLAAIVLKIFSFVHLLTPENARYALDSLYYYEFHVLNVSPFLVMSVGYITKDLDKLYWQALRYTDFIAKQRHPDRETYSDRFATTNYMFAADEVKVERKMTSFFHSYLRTASITTAAYFLSKVPFLGRLVFPVMAFRNLSRSVGSLYAFIFSVINLVLPPSAAVFFLNSIMGTRSLMLILLEPYFNRIPFTQLQKSRWYLSRIGCLYGFSFFYYFCIIRAPFLLSVIPFALAQGATAMLISKVTEPPPVLTRTDRLEDLKLLSNWMDDQCDWNKEIDDVEEIIKDFEYVVPGTFVNNPVPSPAQAATASN